MKRLIFYSNVPFTGAGLSFGILLICFCSLFILGCKKDLIQSDSSSSKEFSVILPQEVGTLIRGVKGGDSIKAQIRFLGQAGNQFDISAYTYLWTSLTNKDTLSTKHYLTFNDFDKQDPTLISCLLTVKEKSTGIIKHATSSVFLTTPTREGWVLLGDQSGIAKLSVLTYTLSGYKKYVDIASELGINIPFKGKPISINALGSEMPMGIGKYQWLGITTDQEIKFMRTMDFMVNERISDYLTQTLQPSASHPVILMGNGQSTFVATRDNNVYDFNNMYMVYFGMLINSQLNTYSPREQGAPTFRASAQHTFSVGPPPFFEYNHLMYDEDNYQFVRADIDGNPGINGVFPLQLPFSLEGFLLKAISTRMEINKEESTAFLHNPSKNESYVIQFLSNGIMKSVKKVQAEDANDIVQSKFIEVDYNTGYLIYTKGSNVNAYDYKMGQTVPLLNLGNEQITLMKMTKYIPTDSKMPGRIDIYKQLLKRLIVCTFNPSNPNNGGTFRLFKVPLGHQSLVKETEETGFPKIVDATFAPIP